MISLRRRVKEWLVRRTCFHHDHATGESWLHHAPIAMAGYRPWWCDRCNRDWGEAPWMPTSKRGCCHHNPETSTSWIRNEILDWRKRWWCTACSKRWII